MELGVDVRAVCSMSGSEMLTTLDTLHTTMAGLETYRLQVMAGLDHNGHAKTLGARDTVELLAFRHRLDKTAVRRDLKLATNLAKYTMVSAALPDPFAPTSPDGAIQYGAPAAAPATAADPAGDDPNKAGDGDSAGETGEAGDGATGDGGGAGEQLPVLLHPAQAEAIVSALDKVPTAAMVPVEDLLVAEEQMVEAGRRLAPLDLRKLGRQVRDRLDTDGPEPAEDAAYRREALWLRNADQGVTFGGYLANENAELLRTPDPRRRETAQDRHR